MDNDSESFGTLQDLKNQLKECEEKKIDSLSFLMQSIGDEGVKFISQSLEKNQTLTKLNLWDNQIGVEGAKFISQSLEKNQTLTELYLELKNDEIRQKIEGILEQNKERHEKLKNQKESKNQLKKERENFPSYFENIRDLIDTKERKFFGNEENERKQNHEIMKWIEKFDENRQDIERNSKKNEEIFHLLKETTSVLQNLEEIQEEIKNLNHQKKNANKNQNEKIEEKKIQELIEKRDRIRKSGIEKIEKYQNLNSKNKTEIENYEKILINLSTSLQEIGNSFEQVEFEFCCFSDLQKNLQEMKEWKKKIDSQLKNQNDLINYYYKQLCEKIGNILFKKENTKEIEIFFEQFEDYLIYDEIPQKISQNKNNNNNVINSSRTENFLPFPKVSANSFMKNAINFIENEIENITIVKKENLRLNQILKQEKEALSIQSEILKPIQEIKKKELTLRRQIRKEKTKIEDLNDDLEDAEDEKERKEIQQKIVKEQSKFNESILQQKKLKKERYGHMNTLRRYSLTLFPELPLLEKDLNLEEFVQKNGICIDPDLSLEDFENVQSVQSLGRNSLSIAERNGVKVALKKFELSTEKKVSAFKKEARLLMKLQHPNIVPIISAFLQKDKVSEFGFIEMPFFKNGDLLSWRNRQEMPPSEAVLKRMLQCAFRGLEYLHAAKVVHCDIKPANMLVADDLSLMISDFDMSNDTETRSTTLSKTLIGITVLYAAPEILKKGEKATFSSDIWSLAISFLEIFFFPETLPKLISQIEYSKVKNLKGDKKLLDLLDKCLPSEPQSRISASKALSHDYFTNLENFSALPVAPIYWKSRHLQNPQVKLIDVSHKMLNQIQEIMKASTIAKDLGIGRDLREKGGYNGLKVIKVQRIENSDLWTKYAAQKIQLEKKFGNANLPEIKTLIDRDWMKRFELRSDINEKYLWTGIPADLKQVIINQGLEERVASLRGLFGAGVYFAECASKSDQYVVSDSSGNFYFLLCRVLLGNPFVTIDTHSNVRRLEDIPQIKNNTHGSSPNANNLEKTSLLGECRRTGFPNAFLQRHREFVIYDRTLCYPEFLITFTRV